jgi:hypothetical protein
MVDGIPYEAINHSSEAQSVTNYVSQFFLHAAKRNTHRFATPDAEQEALIYNYQAVYTGPEFVQSYYFHF